MHATLGHSVYANPDLDYELVRAKEVSGGLGKERAGIGIPTYGDSDYYDIPLFVSGFERLVGHGQTTNRTTLQCTVDVLDDEAYPWERLDTRSDDAGGSSSTRIWGRLKKRLGRSAA